MSVLKQEQKAILENYCKEFQGWIGTDNGKHTIMEHREHERYFKERLSSENLAKMTEEVFMELYKKLWASNVWRNKDWYIKNKLIQPNGLEKIKHELKNLLYGFQQEKKRKKVKKMYCLHSRQLVLLSYRMRLLNNVESGLYLYLVILSV